MVVRTTMSEHYDDLENTGADTVVDETPFADRRHTIRPAVIWAAGSSSIEVVEAGLLPGAYVVPDWLYLSHAIYFFFGIYSQSAKCNPGNLSCSSAPGKLNSTAVCAHEEDAPWLRHEESTL